MFELRSGRPARLPIHLTGTAAVRLRWAEDNRCKRVSETTAPRTETAGFFGCIGVVSCGFEATADQLGAGTALEVKCLFAIDSIDGVYRADWAQRRSSLAKRA